MSKIKNAYHEDIQQLTTNTLLGVQDEHSQLQRQIAHMETDIIILQRELEELRRNYRQLVKLLNCSLRA